jgi:serine O-acetyltransferase
MMNLSLPSADLRQYVLRLVAAHLPDGYAPAADHAALFARALERVEYCFAQIHRKYYRQGDAVLFDHLNGDHMATLLYFFGNTVWRETGDSELPTRLFYLNKILHGLDLFYAVTMPDIFMLVHPVGSVLGNARYQDYLVVYQNCTVGAVTDVYPQFGSGTILYSRTTVLGNCRLGNDVVLAANAMIIDLDVPASTVVTGQFPAQRFLPNRRPVRARCFDAAAD